MRTMIRDTPDWLVHVYSLKNVYNTPVSLQQYLAGHCVFWAIASGHSLNDVV